VQPVHGVRHQSGSASHHARGSAVAWRCCIE
jgi:hypothetical protein